MHFFDLQLLQFLIGISFASDLRPLHVAEELYENGGGHDARAPAPDGWAPAVRARVRLVPQDGRRGEERKRAEVRRATKPEEAHGNERDVGAPIELRSHVARGAHGTRQSPVELVGQDRNNGGPGGTADGPPETEGVAGERDRVGRLLLEGGERGRFVFSFDKSLSRRDTELLLAERSEVKAGGGGPREWRGCGRRAPSIGDACRRSGEEREHVNRT